MVMHKWKRKEETRRSDILNKSKYCKRPHASTHPFISKATFKNKIFPNINSNKSNVEIISNKQ